MELKRILIDTNIYGELLRGQAAIVELLKEPEIIAISVITIGELLAGFERSKRKNKNQEELDIFLNSPRVLIYDIDAETTEFYAKIFGELKRADTPIPTNDMWIAALALQHGTKLISMDAHFKKVQGLFLVEV